MTIKRFIDVDGEHLNCPVRQCDGVPHLRAVGFGRNFPPGSTSGPGLVLEYYCEEGHHWQVSFVDHSGGTWLRMERLQDEVPA